jgi:hypothetical protein
LSVGLVLAAGGLTMVILDVVSHGKQQTDKQATSGWKRPLVSPLVAIDATGGFAGVKVTLH